MKTPKFNPTVRRHTVSYYKGYGGIRTMFCTTCGKILSYSDENKRCKSGKK